MLGMLVVKNTGQDGDYPSTFEFVLELIQEFALLFISQITIKIKSAL